MYFNEKIDKSSDPKSAWNSLFSAIGKSKNKKVNIDNIRANNVNITDPVEIANNFIDFFASIGDDIVKKNTSYKEESFRLSLY